MPRIFSLLGRRGWAEANKCDYIQPLTESRTLSLAVIICTLVTSAHSNLPVRVPDYLGERWSLVTMWCKFKQNWPTFPTQYLLIALVIKYWILMSWHLPILTPIKTAPTRDMDWRSLERIFFLSHSVLWVSFIYVFTYLLFFFLVGGGSGMGVLSQNSDFINHLLGCQSLCSKLKKKKNSMALQCCCPRWQRAPTCRSRIVQRSLRICRLVDSPWNSSGSQVWDLASGAIQKVRH